ncbi:MAG TPA: aminoglycoside phosphotransferase family protein [Aestuariivirgaceae bacterium]|nr:aminoglycoside phosphotransferase family protein [Aestuariivirgaceae bacterium]
MPTAQPPAEVNASRARAMARKIISHHFSAPPLRLVGQDGGLSNHVFMVKHKEGDLVVRLSSDPARINAYIKEQWAAAKAKELKVPAPEILEVGNQVIPFPYMVSRRAEGSEATFHPKRLEILRELGSIAARINTIQTTGFGTTFDWSNNQLSLNDSWEEFLTKELDIESRLGILSKRKMLSRLQIRKMSGILRAMGKKRVRPSLNHGDLRLKNVLVSREGAIKAVIDWEDCISLLPFWELSVALHDLSIDEKQGFLEGYGLKEPKIVEMTPMVKALNVINYAPEIERLAEAKDFARLEQYRTRLSGALDLYCL